MSVRFRPARPMNDDPDLCERCYEHYATEDVGPLRWCAGCLSSAQDQAAKDFEENLRRYIAPLVQQRGRMTAIEARELMRTGETFTVDKRLLQVLFVDEPMIVGARVEVIFSEIYFTCEVQGYDLNEARLSVEREGSDDD
jgi:hypothetical protein